MQEKYVLMAILVVLVVLLICNSDLCRGMFNKKPCGCGGTCMCGDKMTSKAKKSGGGLSKNVREAFSSRPYGYNQDTVGKGVAWQSNQLATEHKMDHSDYIRSVGIDKSTVENHRQWYQDPNIKPYYGSNFNLRSETEQTYLVTPHGLRRRLTRVPIGVSARQVPDIDERDYAETNQLGIGNFVFGGSDETVL